MSQIKRDKEENMFFAIGFFVFFFIWYFFVYKKNKTEEESSNFDQVVSVSRNAVTEKAVQNVQIKQELKCQFDGVPDKHGLYPQELLLLYYAPRYETDSDSFPSFWKYNYDIENVKSYLENLVNRGFLKKEMNLQMNLDDLKVVDLKNLLKENSLPVTGKKDDLIKRIIEQVSLDSLRDDCKRLRFLRTETGEKALEEAPYIEYLDRNNLRDVSISEMSKYVHLMPRVDFRKGILEILTEKIKKFAAAGDYGLCRNSKLCLFEFYYLEKQYKDAYYTLLDVIFIDINDFLGNGFDKSSMQFSLDFFFDSEHPKIVEFAFARMAELQTFLNISDEQLSKDMKEHWFEFQIPYHILSVDDCVAIYFAEKTHDSEKMKAIYDKGKSQNLKKGSNGESALIIGRLETGYRNLVIAQRAAYAADYLKSRMSYTKCVESFKQADATFEREKAEKMFEDFAKKDPGFKKLSKILCDVIKKFPGILQSEIMKKFESGDWSDMYDYNRPVLKDDVYYALYFADKFGMIVRNKKGRTYELFVKQEIANDSEM